MVDFEAALSGTAESQMRHHLLVLANLTASINVDVGPCQPVSFTGAVSSQRVTEEREGWLSVVGNHVSSALA